MFELLINDFGFLKLSIHRFFFLHRIWIQCMDLWLANTSPIGLLYTLSHHSVFPKIPLFWSLGFGPIHPPSGMSLRMVLTSVRSALRKRVFGSIPFMTTQAGYLGRRGFKLIIQCPKLIPLVLPWFSVRFANRHHESRSWLATTIVWPTTHVLQASC
jgi:hypothetical protein